MNTVWYELWISPCCLVVTLKVWVLCGMNSEKSFYYSLIWKKLSENVDIAWYKLWKSVYYCLPISLMVVLFDVSSGNVWNVNIVWCLEKCSALFGSNSLKMPIMLDMNSENVFILFGSSSLKVSIVWYELWKSLIWSRGSFCYLFLTIRMTIDHFWLFWIKTISSISDFLEAFLVIWVKTFV